MKKTMTLLLSLTLLLGILSDTQAVSAASKFRKGTFVKSFNSGVYFRAVIIKKVTKKKVTFRMTYSSLRRERWSNTIKGKRKGNKVKFTYKEDYRDIKGSGILTLRKNSITLQTKSKSGYGYLNTDNKAIKIKKKDNTTDDYY